MIDGATSEPPDEGLEPPERPGLDAIANPRSVDLAADEPCLLQNLQVLGDGRLGERQFIHNIPADAGGSAYQDAEDLDPRRVPDGPGERRQLLVGRGTLDGTKVRL